MRLAPDALAELNRAERWNVHAPLEFGPVRDVLEASGRPMTKRKIGAVLGWRSLDTHNKQFAQWVRAGKLKRDACLRYYLPTLVSR